MKSASAELNTALFQTCSRCDGHGCILRRKGGHVAVIVVCPVCRGDGYTHKPSGNFKDSEFYGFLNSDIINNLNKEEQ